MAVLVASVAAGTRVASGATTITTLVASALWSALLGLTTSAGFLALAGEMTWLSALVANVGVRHFILGWLWVEINLKRGQKLRRLIGSYSSLLRIGLGPRIRPNALSLNR